MKDKESIEKMVEDLESCESLMQGELSGLIVLRGMKLLKEDMKERINELNKRFDELEEMKESEQDDG